jgi:ABC-type branched-subunit amino acid transport system ATPase component
VLEVAGVSVRFGGAQVLADVDVTVRNGEICGLIGPNGAGKTTLFNVITGLLRPMTGRVRLEGRDITSAAPHQRARMGVARTFQRLEIFESLTVRENVQVAAEARHGSSAADGRVDEILERTGLAPWAAMQADTLSTGRARMLELARCLALDPKVLLLDEPGSGLDDRESDFLAELLLSLRAERRTILLVEHDVELVMRVCETIHVLDFGKVIAVGPPERVRGDHRVRQAYLGGGQGEEGAGRGRVGTTRARTPRPDEVRGSCRGPATSAVFGASAERAHMEAPAVEFEGVRAAYGRIEVLHGVSFQVRRGSVFALLGANGGGKTTTLKVASGQIKQTGGSVRLDGREIGESSADLLVRRGVCCIPEGRGIFPNLTVVENLEMWTFGGMRLTEVIDGAFTRFPQLANRRGQLAGTLSGGEQQMLAMSRALSTDPRVLLLDEISMGLAPLIVDELYDVVGQLAEGGTTIIVVEQFAQTALRVARDAALMSRGVIEQTGTVMEIADLMSAAYAREGATAEPGRGGSEGTTGSP